MSIKIFTRNKSKDGTTQSTSTNYSISGIGGSGGASSGLTMVTLTGDVIDERATLNGTQLILDTHIGDGRLTWDMCSSNLQSRINSGGGGGGGTQEIEYILTGATTQTIQTALNDGLLPVLRDSSDKYYYFVYEDDGAYFFYSTDDWRIIVDSNGWSSASYQGGMKDVSTTTVGTSLLTMHSGSGISIVKNNTQEVTISATGGGGAPEIEYVNGYSVTQDIDIILAADKLPIFLDANNKYYYFLRGETIAQHTQYYFVSLDYDMWWIDTDDDWHNVSVVPTTIFEATTSTTYDAVEGVVSQKLVILRDNQKAYILSKVVGTTTHQRTYYFYTTEGEGYRLYYDTGNTVWEPLLGIPVRKWIFNDTPPSDLTHTDNYTYSTDGGIRLIAGTGISIANGYVTNSNNNTTYGGIVISNTAGSGTGDVVDDWNSASAGGIAGATLVGYGTTAKHITKAAGCGNSYTPIYIDSDGVATACTGVATTTMVNASKYAQAQYTSNNVTYKYLDPSKVSTIFDPTDADDLWDKSMVEDQYWITYAANNNIPVDFVEGLATGKYNGLEFGQTANYPKGQYTVSMPKAIYTFTGMITIPFTFTFYGQTYGPINVDIYTLQTQYYDFDSAAMICYNIQFLKWVDSYSQPGNDLDRINIVVKGAIGFEPEL